MKQTRKVRAKKLLERLQRGPALSLLTGLTPEAEREVHQRYKIWFESWIEPEIKDLVPELKKPTNASVVTIGSYTYGLSCNVVPEPWGVVLWSQPVLLPGWHIVNTATGQTKYIGPTRTKGTNYFDLAVAEASRRNKEG